MSDSIQEKQQGTWKIVWKNSSKESRKELCKTYAKKTRQQCIIYQPKTNATHVANNYAEKHANED